MHQHKLTWWRSFQNPDLMKIISQGINDVTKLVSYFQFIEYWHTVRMYSHSGRLQ